MAPEWQRQAGCCSLEIAFYHRSLSAGKLRILGIGENAAQHDTV